MTVVRLLLAYDGTGFHGWASQPRVPTIQHVVEDALQKVLSGQRPRLSVAGRTDAGVHAHGQVVSFSAPDDADPARIRSALNAMLGPQIAVRAASRAPAGFDARHSAIGRDYRYRIDLAEAPDPFTIRFVWHRPSPLDVPAMNEAAAQLVGEHDFASFCRLPQTGSTTRRLERLEVRRVGREVRVDASANAFLHQMVRSLVGTLVRVGDGRIAALSMGSILAARDRSAAGRIAPPQGLTLLRVRYRRGGRLGGSG